MTELNQANLRTFASSIRSGRRPGFRALFRAAVALCVPLVFAGQARAQTDADVNPQMPNVLLLVDTSGSMEYKTSSNVFPACKYDATSVIPNGPVTSEKSRWVDLVEVLTGSITNYECQTLDRGSAAFKNEYKITGSSLPNSPYDFLYANPYHRPLSGGCAPGPGTISTTNPADFPSNSFNYHTYNNTSSSCSFTQAPDGILDAFQSGIRFGLMTFDTDPSPDKGELGTYSYVVGASHSGKPIGCTTASPMEVGARNAAAPPWEGRLIPFGNPQPGSLDYQDKNQQIQQVLRASRPYGATPIAGMLSDARDFLWNDTSDDPVDPSQHFGPSQDPYASCRQSVLLLLSDGQPNMDLRGHCTGNDCPFQLPEDIARDLLTASGRKPVKTYVVGFALNTLTVGGNAVDCSALQESDLDTTPSALCTANPDNAALQACCNLARIAVAGDVATNPNRHAFFASDREELRSDISTILGQQFPTTSRTQAAFSGASGSTPSELAPAASYRFFSDFSPVLFQTWTGQVKRERWICDDTHQPVRVEPDATKGDLFADNLNSQSGRVRTFYTVQPEPSAGGVVRSDYSIRPNLNGTDPDGVGAVSGTTVGATADTFVANTSPASMGLDNTSCPVTVGGVTTYLSPTQCRDKYLKWLVGGDNGTVFNRCKPPPVPNAPPPPLKCNLLGDIYHATPRVVNAPNELTRDDTYLGFQGAYATRPLMLYTSSNDGMLHAFKVASNLVGDSELVDAKKNNELWAFIPAEVLPHVASEYPYTHQLLMDGVSVVKDVVARKTSGTYPYVFERTLADAQAGASASTTWRTILVQGFGGTYPGYFALDITNPDPAMTLNSEAGGPKFLWQVTSDASGNPLFGSGGATPIITTLLIDEDSSGAREVPVAILPGGSGGAGSAGPISGSPGCPRATSDLSKFASYPPRPRVPCYTGNLGARSLTIVRLDTGKIIRTFRRSKLEMPTGIQNLVTESPLDSPITGEPMAYPADVGSVADRIFVGDQDGTLWKVDVSNKSPDQWTMSLFWDAYPAIQIHSKPKADWNSGQPIATAPVLSVDTQGNLTIAFSTGDQGSPGAATGMLNYVWSLRDLPNASHELFADPLWLLQLENGERVTGPMSLFNSFLYFSTVTPPAANAACTSTNGARVWGMHYITPRDGEGTAASPPDRTVGGLPAPFIKENFGTNDQFVTDTTLLGTNAQNQAVIFGVTVAQVPTCFAVDTVTDAYLGAGSRVSDANPGKFQLVIQTGSATLGTGGKAEAAAPTGGGVVSLPKVAVPAHIEAWASIVE
ncbi:MAG: hypothetical protein WDO69_20715 [Pseudomonadota bacterium]